eukprot:10050634-Alexandrium_andersonii.AAC.1
MAVSKLGVPERLPVSRPGGRTRRGAPPEESSAPSSAIGPSRVLVLEGGADVAPRCRLGGGCCRGPRPAGSSGAPCIAG